MYGYCQKCGTTIHLSDVDFKWYGPTGVEHRCFGGTATERKQLPPERAS